MEAKVAGWTRYYKGEITSVNSDGTYDIRFDDGERKRGVRDDQIKGNDDRDDRSSSSSSSSRSRREGDRVEAKVAGWTRYYKGEITRVNSDGTYDIRFDDGERKRGVRDDQIKGNNDDRSSSRRSRREGDRVEAKVAGWTRYYKGEITRVNSDGTYDIRFDDGERKRGVRDDQIKGNDDRDDRSCLIIVIQS